MITVRPAAVGDIPALVRLSESLHAEAVHAFPPIDHDKMREGYRIFAESPVALLAVAERDGEIVGLITAVLSSYFFSAVKITLHDLIYVAPAHRGSVAALKLIRFYERWAKSHGVWEARIATHTGINTKRNERFYERLGFQYMGGTYRKVF